MPKRSLYLDLATGNIDSAVSATIAAATGGLSQDQTTRNAAPAAVG